jgi:Cdc6-like AAA superfamily ATPase
VAGPFPEVVVSWYRILKSRRRAVTKPLALEALHDANETMPTPPAPFRPSRPGRQRRGESWFPSFHATASDQPRPGEGDRFAEARLRLRTAYTPSQPVIDRKMFAGRAEVLTTLIRSLEDERLHTIIYGERGIGKTSLLHVIAQAARDARYLVTYISCGAASDFDEAFRAVAADIPLLFHSGYGPSSPEAEQGATLADVLPAARISVRQASDYLAKIVGTRVLIVLDEFDRVESAGFRLSIAEFLKNLSDRSVRVQLLIAGVAANLTELVEHIPSIQRSIFAMRVPRMSEAEVRELVKVGEENSHLIFEEAARRLIVSAANGLPYLASLLSHHAGLEAIEKSRLDVTVADAAAAVAKALNEQEARISKRSQGQIAYFLQEGGAVLLGGLSNLAQLGGGAFSVDDLASTWPGPEGAAHAPSLVKKLAAEGILSECREDEFSATYRFAEESVPIYLWLLAAQARFGDKQTLSVHHGADRTSAVL